MTTCIFLGFSSGTSKKTGAPYFLVNFAIPFDSPCMPTWKSGKGFDVATCSLKDAFDCTPQDFVNLKPNCKIDLDIRNMNLKWVLLSADFKSVK